MWAQASTLGEDWPDSISLINREYEAQVSGSNTEIKDKTASNQISDQILNFARMTILNGE